MIERGGEDVAIEEHVEVLVERDALEELLGQRVTRRRAGIAMRDARGEFLEGDVRHAVQQAWMDGLEAGGHVHHARILERDRIHGPRDDEVVADRDGVPVFLGGPAADPGPPRSVAAEDARDLVVVTRQVVLGEEVDDQARAGGVAVALLLGRPVLTAEEGEIAALVPRHVVVGIPRLMHLQVPLELGGDHRLEIDQEPDIRGVVHSGHGPSVPRPGATRDHLSPPLAWGYGGDHGVRRGLVP